MTIRVRDFAPAMALPSFDMPAVWGSKASSRCGLARLRERSDAVWLKTKNPDFERRRLRARKGHRHGEQHLGPSAIEG
jgi:hypothetical protein